MNNRDKIFCNKKFWGTCSSVEILKGYMLICWNTVWVHAHLSECWRGTWQEKDWEPLLYIIRRRQLCVFEKKSSLYFLALQHPNIVRYHCAWLEHRTIEESERENQSESDVFDWARFFQLRSAAFWYMASFFLFNLRLCY